jgi:LysM repeat protein
MKNSILLLIFSFVATIICAQESYTTEHYIETYADWAVAEMERSGIPASITLGQGILESGSGNSRLAREANNHFGIKCHSDWDGDKIYHDDDASQECFRKYKSAYESFKDHSVFLRKYSRYAFLFDLETTDYKGWAKGLKKAGYATNPQYADILIGLIERYELYVFDKPGDTNIDLLASDVLRQHVTPGFTDNWTIDPFNREMLSNNGRPLFLARGGDNVTSIAQEFDMMPWQIYKYNDMDKQTDSIIAGQIVYLKPKRNKADKGYETHTVKAGETLWTISQDYGVKLDKLRKRNDLDEDAMVNPGDTIYLREPVDGKSFLGIF